MRGDMLIGELNSNNIYLLEGAPAAAEISDSEESIYRSASSVGQKSSGDQKRSGK
jgi:hypothetical protein